MQQECFLLATGYSDGDTRCRVMHRTKMRTSRGTSSYSMSNGIPGGSGILFAYYSITVQGYIHGVE
jgi:hypothetical protein